MVKSTPFVIATHIEGSCQTLLPEAVLTEVVLFFCFPKLFKKGKHFDPSSFGERFGG